MLQSTIWYESWSYPVSLGGLPGAGRDPEVEEGRFVVIIRSDLELMLMVQKSHSQPPFGCIKPCK